MYVYGKHISILWYTDAEIIFLSRLQLGLQGYSSAGGGAEDDEKLSPVFTLSIVSGTCHECHVSRGSVTRPPAPVPRIHLRWAESGVWGGGARGHEDTNTSAVKFGAR